MKLKTISLIILSFFLLTAGILKAQTKSEQLNRIKTKLSPSGLRSTVSMEKDSSDYSLKPELNLPRTGDYLIKLEAAYLSPGESGDSVVWDFNGLQLTGGEYNMDYFVYPKSSLTAIENGSLQYYHASGDSLLLEGYENPLTLVRLEKPEEVMVFPAVYGAEKTGWFYGKGRYCDQLEMDVTGLTYSKVDGQGTLVLPENDTILDVLRVNTLKISFVDSRPISPGFDILAPAKTPPTHGDILMRLDQDSPYMISEIYRWYSRGYRYPVLEIVKSWNEVNGQSENVSEKTYVYHPFDQQAELPSDTANLALLTQKEKQKSEIKSVTKEEKLTVSSGFEIKTYPNPVVKELQIQIQSEHHASAKVFVYGLQGQLLTRQDSKVQPGIHVETLNMSQLPKGSYILKVDVGDKSEKKVIVKQ